MSQPTRVGLSLGSTTRLTEFDFSKISVSLERDLVPAENPVDAYRDIKALLERMVTEFQVGKASNFHAGVKVSPKTQQSNNAVVTANHAPAHDSANRQLTADFKAKESPIVSDNQAVPPSPAASKPAGPQLETVRERLAKWLPDLEITNGFDGFALKPRRFLGDAWKDVNEVVRSLGGKWIRGQTPRDGAWRIGK